MRATRPIKTWQTRLDDGSVENDQIQAMQDEIDELRHEITQITSEWFVSASTKVAAKEVVALSVIPMVLVLQNKFTKEFNVRLISGNQSFPVGVTYDSKDDADWYAEMLRIALDLPGCDCAEPMDMSFDDESKIPVLAYLHSANDSCVSTSSVAYDKPRKLVALTDAISVIKKAEHRATEWRDEALQLKEKLNKFTELKVRTN